MANPVGEAIYTALSGTDVTTYVMGDVPEGAQFPYLTYSVEAVRGFRVSINNRLQTRELIVEVLARSIAEAEEIAASVDEAIVGISVAAADDSIPFTVGFERAEGVWRSFDTDPSDIDGDRYYRIVLFFEQRETV